MSSVLQDRSFQWQLRLVLPGVPASVIWESIQGRQFFQLSDYPGDFLLTVLKSTEFILYLYMF